MKLLLHAFNTWLVANLLHPFLFAIWFFAFNREFIDIGEAGFFLFFLILSFVYSVPAFLLLLPLLYLISKGPFSVNDKLFLWVVVILLLLFSTFYVFLFLGNGDIKWGQIELMIPAALSVVISILIRRNAFINLQLFYSIK
jgi:hypothetical protein